MPNGRGWGVLSVCSALSAAILSLEFDLKQEECSITSIEYATLIMFKERKIDEISYEI